MSIAVLTLANMDGADIDDVGHAVFNAWGVGRKGLDNGVLLVWAVGERKIRIETGKGVGGELTDLQSNDIIQKMKPAARAGQFALGINIAIDSINSSLENRGAAKHTADNTSKSPAPAHTSSGCDSSGEGSGFSAVAGIVILLIIIFLILRRRGGGGGSFWGSGGSWGSSGGSWGSSGGSSSGGGFGGGESGGGGSSDSY